MDRQQDDDGPHQKGYERSPKASQPKPHAARDRSLPTGSATTQSGRNNCGSQFDRAAGRPPSDTRFRPGQSGNLAGRPKGSKNLKTLLESALCKLVTIAENGKQVRKTAGEVVLRRLTQEAMKGDHKAIELLLRFARDLGLGESREEKASPRTGDDDGRLPDKAALRRILKRFQNLDLSAEVEPDHER
jgi:Family of unknown function (DUF5681)